MEAVGNDYLDIGTGKDFHLQSTSPAIDAGMSISEVPNDYDGNTSPKGPRHDIGALEFLK